SHRRYVQTLSRSRTATACHCSDGMPRCCHRDPRRDRSTDALGCRGRDEQVDFDNHGPPARPRHRLPSSVLAARLTLTRSCAPYVRTIVTSESTRLTRTLAVFPPAVVYGRPLTSSSPVSSVSRSPNLKLHRKDARAGWRRLRLALVLGARPGQTSVKTSRGAGFAPQRERP